MTGTFLLLLPPDLKDEVGRAGGVVLPNVGGEDEEEVVTGHIMPHMVTMRHTLVKEPEVVRHPMMVMTSSLMNPMEMKTTLASVRQISSPVTRHSIKTTLVWTNKDSL